jgi:hypothetical protein
MGEMRNGYLILVGELDGKRPLGRHGHRWEHNIRKDLTEREWEHVNWIHLAQDRDHWQAVVNTIMNFRAP